MLPLSLKFAFRLLLKNRLSSSIKISGLALSMTCVLLTLLFIKDEYSYDNFHEKGSRIYRITTQKSKDGARTITGSTSQVQGPAFKSKVPEVEDYTRVWSGFVSNVATENKSIALDVTYADENFFSIFTFPLIFGNATTALSSIHTIVLTEETAKKLYGTTDVVGRTVKIEGDIGSQSFIITGVTRSLPSNSSLKFDAIVPFSYLQSSFDDKDWLNAYVSTFLLLHSDTDIASVETKFDAVFRNEAADQLRNSNLNGYDIKYGLQPLSDVHLSSFGNSGAETLPDNNITGESITVYSYILGALAAFILIMAIVNFLNLSVSRLMDRHKEIAMRKICGSSVKQLITQLSVEGVVICFIAYILSIALTFSVLPVFNELSGKSIHLILVSDLIYFVAGFLLLIGCVILIAFYLFLKLNASGTVKLLQNKQRWHGQNTFGRGMIVLQFAFAIGLMFSAVVYYRQMNFISSKDVGFNPNHLIQIEIPHSRTDPHTTSLFKQELKNLQPVTNVTSGGMHPFTTGTFDINDVQFAASEFHVDEEYIPALQVNIKDGRNFSAAMTTDSDAVIVNESFVRKSGWDHPLLKKIEVGGKPHTVIGVIRDYHTTSFKQMVRPQVITLGDNDNIMLRLRNDQHVSSLANIEKVFNKHYPEHYFQITFLDDAIGDQYANELRWKTIISYATVIAILICCMGLFGMGHFTTQKRTKEIGIRKVLGASVPNLVNVIVSDFLKPVVVPALLVLPIAWYIMNRWLEDYYYRISINAIDILLTSVTAFLIVIISVGSAVLRSALQNPVVSLKVE